MRITEALEDYDDYFVQKKCEENLRLATVHETTAAMRMLEYGSSANSTDEYVRIGEGTAIESLNKFCTAVDEVFSDQCLRKPTEKDVKRLYEERNERGFPVCSVKLIAYTTYGRTARLPIKGNINGTNVFLT